MLRARFRLDGSCSRRRIAAILPLTVSVSRKWPMLVLEALRLGLSTPLPGRAHAPFFNSTALPRSSPLAIAEHPRHARGKVLVEHHQSGTAEMTARFTAYSVARGRTRADLPPCKRVKAGRHSC